LILLKVFFSPTDAQVNYLKNNFRIYTKIDIKKAPSRFFALLVLAKVTAVKIAILTAVTAPKHVGAILM
jgi:hypothetical protein